MMKPEDLCKRNLQRINEILKYQSDIVRVYGNKGHNIITQSFVQMSKDMDKLIANKEVPINKAGVNLVINGLDLMIDTVIFNQISKIVEDLSIEYSKLVFNWNTQVAKNEMVHKKSQMLNRIVTCKKTLDDTIWIVKRLLDRIKYENTRRPVAYEMSKHYLETLPTE